MNKYVRRALTVSAALLAPILINNAVFARAKALGNTLGGEGRFWPWREGDVFYTKQGKGAPSVLLLHGFYPGACVYEWRKNFDVLGEHFDVTALDWLGFGLSDKPHIKYSASLYIDLLRDFIREVIGKPTVIIATGLAGTFAVEAALALPELVQGLVIINPEIAGRSKPEPIVKNVLYATLDAPIVGVSLYNLVTSRAATRSMLQSKVFFDPSYVTDEMVDQFSTASHQYGSQYAISALMSGALEHDAAASYALLPQPLLRVIGGREAGETVLPNAQAYLAANNRTELDLLDKAALWPQDEQAGAFNRLVTQMINAAPHPEDSIVKPVRRTRSRKTEPNN
jgi:pimeloyl-ACP methyl ester carboxylesterase